MELPALQPTSWAGDVLYKHVAGLYSKIRNSRLWHTLNYATYLLIMHHMALFFLPIGFSPWTVLENSLNTGSRLLLPQVLIRYDLWVVGKPSLGSRARTWPFWTSFTSHTEQKVVSVLSQGCTVRVYTKDLTFLILDRGKDLSQTRGDPP